jgi:hypothetical protein
MISRSDRKDVVAVLAAARLFASDQERALPTVSICNISQGGALLEIEALAARDIDVEKVSKVYLSCSLFPTEIEALPVWSSVAPSALLIGVRFLSLDSAARDAIDKHLRDQRGVPRQDAEFIGSVRRVDGTERYRVIVDNISVTGALVWLVDQRSAPLERGDDVEFSCQYLFIGTIECPAQIVWLNNDGTNMLLGLQFLSLRDADRRIIEKFVG